MRPGSKESKELLLGRMVILNVACDLRSLSRLSGALDIAEARGSIRIAPISGF
jgi:hypothetical protein